MRADSAASADDVVRIFFDIRLDGPGLIGGLPPGERLCGEDRPAITETIPTRVAASHISS